MYKSRLQELCHKKSWTLPEYQTTREGPDHNPRFSSTITVNGVHFQTQSPCRTAKEAQNNAAKLAFDHFLLQSEPSLQQNSPSSFAPSPSKPSSFPQPTFPQPSFSQHTLPRPSFPQPTLLQPTLPRPSFTQPNLPRPSFPQPNLPRLSFPQPSLAHLLQPNLPQPSAPTASGLSGPGTDVCNKTRTVSQPKSQEACQTPPVNSPAAAVRDPMTAINLKNDSNLQHLYKNQLQNYAQKRNISLPVYSPERVGPPHASRFKCKVTIDGQTYESPELFSTLKDAEHAAAKVALMSLSPDGTEEDDTALYKNLLQELIQKEGFHLPKYSTDKSGEAHIPRFLSKLEIEGEIFIGQEARTKKQAEMSAAKVAYTILKDRKGKSDQSPSLLFPAPQGQSPRLSSSSSESTITTGLQEHANLKPPLRSSLEITTQNQSEKDKGCVKPKIHHIATPSSEPTTVTGKKGLSLSADKDEPSSGITNGCIKDSCQSNDQPSPATTPNCVNTSKSSSDKPSSKESTFRRKISVYSRETNVDIPQGGSPLPISNEKWVVYSN